MRFLGGHLGATVSAVVDGQLPTDAAERAWAHIAQCPSCRGAVEREAWVKNRLALMSGQEPRPELVGLLSRLGEDPLAAEAWAAVAELERRGRGRRLTGVAIVGAGSVSAAVFGFATLGGPTLSGAAVGGTPGTTSATSIAGAGATGQPVRTNIGSRATAHGRIPGLRAHRAPADPRAMAVLSHSR